MKMRVEIGKHTYLAHHDKAHSLAIPLRFNAAQPACFGSEPASAAPLQAGGFIGDVSQGGSCNVPVLRLNPHCNGTHTESISHIIDETLPPWSLAPLFLPCTLVTLDCTAATQTTESYRPVLRDTDRVITAAALRTALANAEDAQLQALVIRTRPNPPEKQHRDYRDAPFFTIEAMHYLAERGVHHLLVDFPSIDRMNDDGHLTAHHLFWGVPEDGHRRVAESFTEATVTELIYVPDQVADGSYLLNLQLPAFELDVAPSRPVLIPLEELTCQGV